MSRKLEEIRREMRKLREEELREVKYLNRYVAEAFFKTDETG